MRVLTILAFSAAAAAPTATQQAPQPASQPASQPERSAFWQFQPEATLLYDLSQRIEVKNSLKGAPPGGPMEIVGTIAVRTIDAKRALVRFEAQQQAAAEVREAAPEPPKPSCSCRRVASPPAAKEAAPPPLAPPEAKRMAATFELTSDGIFSGGLRTAGGQTELLLGMIFGLPSKKLGLGESDSAPVEVAAVGGRFPLTGKRQLRYDRDETVAGQRCAVLVSETELSGAARPGVSSGAISLRSKGQGCFDFAAGRFLRAEAETQLQMTSTRRTDGGEQQVVVTQSDKTTVTLRSPGPTAQ